MAILLSPKWYRAQLAWIKLMVGRYERQAYLDSHLVLINYESVRRIVVAQYGSGVKFRKLPYTCESALFPSETEAFTSESRAIFLRNTAYRERFASRCSQGNRRSFQSFGQIA